MTVIMFMLDLVSWWYGRGWSGTVQASIRRIEKLSAMFSVEILVRTLFSPWRRIISYPGAGLQERLRALGDNVVSRCIGFTVRAFVLLAAAILFILLGIASVLEIALWPFVPVAGVGLIVWGLIP